MQMHLVLPVGFITVGRWIFYQTTWVRTVAQCKKASDLRVTTASNTRVDTRRPGRAPNKSFALGPDDKWRHWPFIDQHDWAVSDDGNQRPLLMGCQQAFASEMQMSAHSFQVELIKLSEF